MTGNMEKVRPAPSVTTISGPDTYSSKIELAYNGSREDLDPYIPSEHRAVESNTSTFGALAHLLKASLGSGVLAMPLAFKNAGLLVGAIGTALVGLICGHAIHVLVRTSQELCAEVKKPCLGYAATCDLVFQNGPKPVRKFATFARELADWALAVTHLGACCVYVVAAGTSFQQVLTHHGAPEWSLQIYAALMLIVLVPLTQIRNLKYLVPFSTFANFVWLFSICISMYYCMRDPPPINERRIATGISGIPNFISTSLFAMEGIGVVMPIENEMLKPHQFLGCPGVLNIAMTAVVTMYGFVGFMGYWQYGDNIGGQLIHSLPQDEILAQTANLLVACVMLLSFALVYYVPVDVVWRRIQNRIPAKAQNWSMAGLRLFGTLLIVAVACAIPKIHFFMDLVGAVCLSVMGLLLPAVVETIWRWSRDLTPCHWVVWKNGIIVVFSLVAMVSGFTYALIDLVNNV
ncbi:proton-coupled amino acid transporter-like protein pathetic [Pectinophora gossypiella]|nr:proton-coupled amino acid transporter-like protein pathetic [Pectinophora gossypiella]XP_049865316.1 proton-coupled amino acid transporter-like protein pathetic [Pectinophora gossypiella]XP_049865317.1 proton-coupled amino acid transporter-like protein pathetic [Pectinophora gossypiella]